MFLQNRAWTWATTDSSDGVVYNPKWVHRWGALTRERISPSDGVVILDPAWYLGGLDLDSCGTWCSRLATYPWMPVDRPDLPDSGSPDREWLGQLETDLQDQWPIAVPTSEDDVRVLLNACLEFQQQFGVSYAVLPLPIIDDPDSSLEHHTRWLEQAVRCASSADLPVLVQVAISDICLLNRDPPDNDLLEALVDNLAVRDELSGIYLVLIQAVGDDRAVY